MNAFRGRNLPAPRGWWLIMVPLAWLAGVIGGGWHLWRALQNFLAAAGGPEGSAELAARGMAAPVAIWALLNTLGWIVSLAVLIAVFSERTKRRRLRAPHS